MANIRRRLFLGGAVAISALPAGMIRAQSTNTIKIGIVAPLSGSQAPVGQTELEGAQIARDQINAQGGVLGKQIELVPLDDQANPTRAVAAVREHAGNGVNLLMGPCYTATATAVLPIIRELKVVVVNPSSTDERLTHSLFNTNYFNFQDTNYVRFKADTKAIAEKFPDVTSWTAIIFEGASGHEQRTTAKKFLTDWYSELAKKQVSYIEPMFCALGTTDFKPQISQLMASPAEGLVVTEPGSDGPTFYQQMLSFGLQKKIKVFLDMAAEINVGLALGSQVPPNIWIDSAWNPTAANNKLSRELGDEYTKRTGKVPFHYVGTSYTAIQFYANAIKQTGGTDTEKIIQALEDMHMETVKGPAYIRKEDHALIADVYLYNLKPKKEAPGFDVDQSVTVHMADVIYPPTPGKEFTY